MKRSRVLWLMASAYVLASCSCNEQSTSATHGPVGAGAGGASGTAAGGSGGSTAGMDSGSAGVSAQSGAGGGPPIAGNDDASIMLPDASDVSATDAGPALVTEPRIPAPLGDCPDLITGKQTILGLETHIFAGEPSATQGSLLFVWHSTGDTADRALARVPEAIRDDIRANGGLIIAPNDNQQTREGRDIVVSLDIWFESDLRYADHIVACAVQNHNIDPRRIYVSGCLAGAMMAATMTVARSSYIAAAMISAGGIATMGWPIFDEPGHVPPVFATSGAPALVFIDFDQLTRMLGDQLAAAGGLFVYCNPNMGPCNVPADLHETAWAFMKAHPFGAAPDGFAGGLPAGYPEYCSVHE